MLTPATRVSPCSSPPKSCQSPGATPTATAGLSGCQNTRHQPRSQRPTSTTVCVLTASPSSCAFACNPSPDFTVMRTHGGQTVRHGKARPKSEPLQLLVGPDLALSFRHMLALCSQAASAPACSGPNLHHHLLLPCAHDKSQQPQSRTPIARASAAASAPVTGPGPCCLPWPPPLRVHLQPTPLPLYRCLQLVPHSQVCVCHWLWPLPVLAPVPSCWTWRCCWGAKQPLKTPCSLLRPLVVLTKSILWTPVA